jgi:hypothetical protein
MASRETVLPYEKESEKLGAIPRRQVASAAMLETPRYILQRKFPNPTYICLGTPSFLAGYENFRQVAEIRLPAPAESPIRYARRVRLSKLQTPLSRPPASRTGPFAKLEPVAAGKAYCAG